MSDDNTPKVYGYSRVSHAEGYAKGDSPESQAFRIQQYYDVFLKPEGYVWAGVDNDGENISAYKTKFQSRPAGRRLLSVMKNGDHLVVDKIDRLWRSMDDMAVLIKLLEARGVTIHIVSFLGQSFKSGTPLSEFMLKFFVLAAELESATKAERTKEALHRMRNKGTRICSQPPTGCRLIPIIRPDGTRERTVRGTQRQALAWDEKQRRIMGFICDLMDNNNIEWQAAYSQIEEFAAEVEGRPVRTIAEQYSDRKRNWERMLMYERAYRYLGIREPSQIPRRELIVLAAQQARRERTERRGRKGKYGSRITVMTPEQIMALAAR